jgi:ATP-dependent Clp protease adaptor protein ClpS
MSKTAVKVKIKPNLSMMAPKLFKVVYLNDDVTSVEFVIDSLITHFEHTSESAHELTMSIHEQGSAVVAVMPHELAEQKGSEVTVKAHDLGFPLKIKLEQE